MATQNQHKPNDFTPVVAAMEHADYVLHITQSPKWFHDYSVKEQKSKEGVTTKILIFHEDSLTNIVRAEARQIYHLVYTANEINLKRQPWMKEERLGAKYYGRYMDDFYIISSDRAFLERCRGEIGAVLSGLSLHLHPDKTRIFRLPEGIKMLGFTFRLTRSGKVVRIIDPANVKHERKKLFRMAQLVKRGEMTLAKYWECYNAWKAHANLGNSYKLLQRMDSYVRDLFREVKHENSA